jgi:hypothetical protein
MKKELDSNGLEILENKNGNQVMMEWEKPYMKALIDHLSPAGDVLEIGFGLGYSANYIASYPIKSYTVIEMDEGIASDAIAWAKIQSFPVKVVVGPWQETLQFLGKFDSIFFDDFSGEEYPDPLDIRIYEFYYKILKSHVNTNARLVWYCDSPIYWISYPTTTWESKHINVEVSENCKYIKSSNMYLPLVTFPEGTFPDAYSVVLDKYFNFREANL